MKALIITCKIDAKQYEYCFHFTGKSINRTGVARAQFWCTAGECIQLDAPFGTCVFTSFFHQIFSDGAGRTGTYCLIDMVLHRMAKGAREIDIAATLEHVRDQRMKAVRTKQQFEFVLTAVAEEVHAILRALPQ